MIISKIEFDIFNNHNLSWTSFINTIDIFLDCYNRLNISGFVDIDNLSLISKYKYDYILINNIAKVNFLEISKERVFLEKSIIDILNKNFDISINKILVQSVFECYRDIDINIINRNRRYQNSDNKFLVINVGMNWGLCACLTHIANHVRYAKENGFIPVIDMMIYHNQYLYDNEIGKLNAWDKFFFQPSNYDIEMVMKSKNVFWSALLRHNKIKNKSNMFDFLRIKPDLLERCKSFEKVTNGKNRGTDYANMKPYGHNIQPTLCEMVTVV